MREPAPASFAHVVLPAGKIAGVSYWTRNQSVHDCMPALSAKLRSSTMESISTFNVRFNGVKKGATCYIDSV